jgi:hypothetical protein
MDLVRKSVKPISVRGGTGNFNWEDVKTDTNREKYLGNSLMAPVGRWQKGKDVGWYTRSKEERTDNGPTNSGDGGIEDEKIKLKMAEQEAMADVLGVPVEVIRRQDRPSKRTKSHHKRYRPELGSRDGHRARPKDDRRARRHSRARSQSRDSQYRGRLRERSRHRDSEHSEG